MSVEAVATLDSELETAMKLPPMERIEKLHLLSQTLTVSKKPVVIDMPDEITLYGNPIASASDDFDDNEISTYSEWV